MSSHIVDLNDPDTREELAHSIRKMEWLLAQPIADGEKARLVLDLIKKEPAVLGSNALVHLGVETEKVIDLMAKSASLKERIEDVYVIDIDGVLADCTHRLSLIKGEGKPNWDEFFIMAEFDEPIHHMISLVKRLSSERVVIAYVTGRPKRIARLTSDWLARHQLPYGPLYMRENGDHRQDYIVKNEIREKLLERYGKITLAFDDRTQVVDMWRANDVPCLQCAKGDY